MPAAPMFAKLRACLLAVSTLALGACDGADRLTDPSDNSTSVAASSPVSFSEGVVGSFSGIPIGISSQPTSAFGSRFNGAVRGDWPAYLMDELKAIKARGGRVVLSFAGNERHFKTDGYFDLSKWKARIDRYKGLDFTSYINDGTILAHYLIDEPNDPYNWNGKPVPPSVLEEMARYSKQLWPTMVTIVRAEPGYLGSNHYYLDAGWAQYVTRKGTAADYLSRNVSEAQKKGLGLVVGMNLIRGGPNGRAMTAGEVKEWGSILLSGSYPCAFLSWTWDVEYLDRPEMQASMDVLAEKARSRQAKSCSVDGQTSGTVTEPAPAPAPATSGISLAVKSWQESGRNYMRLTWSGASGSSVDVYRNGKLGLTTANDGKYTNSLWSSGGSSYAYKVCEAGSSRCSNTVTVDFN